MADNIFTFDDDDFGFSGSNYTASSTLCVPQDPIDEIELYPNFLDDSISLSGLDFSLESETSCDNEHKARVMIRQQVALQDSGNGFLAKKKQRRKTEGMNEVEKHWQRKCSHCKTTQTPQWRMGPLGPKTLCNACGVRYKSGRLLPEYRPAASPTFDSHVHSNFHRKILKKNNNGCIG